MSTALLMPSADFSVNKLDVVDFAILCEGIELDKTSGTATNTAPLAIAASVTPLNTTQPIVWSTSDAHIATVNNGVVTAVSDGQATITATCGAFSASCAVSVSIGKAFNKGGLITWDYSETIDYPSVAQNPITGFIAFGSDDNGRQICKLEAYADLYPYPIPTGAKTITVTMPNFAPLFVFYNSKTAQTVSPVDYFAGCAKVIDGESSSSNKPNYIGEWTYDTRTITIPDDAAIDSFSLTLHSKATADYNNFDPSNPGISITFGYD